MLFAAGFCYAQVWAFPDGQCYCDGSSHSVMHLYDASLGTEVWLPTRESSNKRYSDSVTEFSSSGCIERYNKQTWVLLPGIDTSYGRLGSRCNVELQRYHHISGFTLLSCLTNEMTSPWPGCPRAVVSHVISWSLRSSCRDTRCELHSSSITRRRDCFSKHHPGPAVSGASWYKQHHQIRTCGSCRSKTSVKNMILSGCIMFFTLLTTNNNIVAWFTSILMTTRHFLIDTNIYIPISTVCQTLSRVISEQNNTWRWHQSRILFGSIWTVVGCISDQ